MKEFSSDHVCLSLLFLFPNLTSKTNLSPNSSPFPSPLPISQPSSMTLSRLLPIPPPLSISQPSTLGGDSQMRDWEWRGGGRELGFEGQGLRGIRIWRRVVEEKEVFKKKKKKMFPNLQLYFKSGIYLQFFQIIKWTKK